MAAQARVSGDSFIRSRPRGSRSALSGLSAGGARDRAVGFEERHLLGEIHLLDRLAEHHALDPPLGALVAAPAHDAHRREPDRAVLVLQRLLDRRRAPPACRAARGPARRPAAPPASLCTMVSPRPGTVWVSWSRPQSATTDASASESGERRMRRTSVGWASARRSATSSSSFRSAGADRLGIQVRIGSSAVGAQLAQHLRHGRLAGERRGLVERLHQLAHDGRLAELADERRRAASPGPAASPCDPLAQQRGTRAAPWPRCGNRRALRKLGNSVSRTPRISSRTGASPWSSNRSNRTLSAASRTSRRYSSSTAAADLVDLALVEEVERGVELLEVDHALGPRRRLLGRRGVPVARGGLGRRRRRWRRSPSARARRHPRRRTR